MAPHTSIKVTPAKATDRAAVVFVKELLDGAESHVDAWGVEGVRALVTRALAGETDGSEPLRASVADSGTVKAYDPITDTYVRVGTWRQDDNDDQD